MKKFQNFSEVITSAKNLLRDHSEIVHSVKWQGIDIQKRPEAALHQILFFDMDLFLQTEDLDYYRKQIEPNLPWADNHFLERVSGQPLNPGKEWANWPFSHSANKFRDGDGRFNHTYMERFWPKYAGVDENGNSPSMARKGIKYEYGDLNDLIEQLHQDPYNRQSWFPIFHPEDIGVANPDRKPCTLGYDFIMGGDHHLHVTYYIRSCDFIRHFRDDIYLTIRLLFWILEKLRNKDSRWNNVKPGRYRMDVINLHMFRNDYIAMYGPKK